MLSALVSVIIPTYGNINSLSDAVDSVLNQTYPNIELIVVDDNIPGSDCRKKTEILMQSYLDDSRVHYYQNSKNSERSASRNIGAGYSHGQYLMFLDNDDVFSKSKAESQLRLLESLGDEYAVSYSDYIRKKDGKTVMRCAENREGYLSFEALSRNLFVHPGSNLMIKRDAFFEVGGFNENLNINEDMELLVKLLRKYKIAYCAETGLTVNVHSKPLVNFQYEESTEKFLRSSENYISQMNEEQKNELYQYIGLQLVRYYIRKSREMKRIVSEYGLKKRLIARYFCYLLKRKLSKKAYGFDL